MMLFNNNLLDYLILPGVVCRDHIHYQTVAFFIGCAWIVRLTFYSLFYNIIITF